MRWPSAKQKNVERMAARLNADPTPMNFSSALRAVRNALADRPDVYVVNEGANTLDFARNIIDMHEPRKRLDSGTWGIMGIGMGYAIAAAVVTGKPVVAIEGDSAFGFSGMEIETICRYKLPVVIVVFNNGGIYRGDKAGSAPSPTGFVPNARYDKLIEAFGGTGYHVPIRRAWRRHSARRSRRDGRRSSIASSIRRRARRAATFRTSTRRARLRSERGEVRGAMTGRRGRPAALRRARAPSP